MSLVVWLPLTKDLRQQGLSDATVTNNGATFDSTGKLGGCYTFGSGKYMRATPASSLMQAKAVSAACWVKITSWNSSYDCLMSWADGTSWTNSRVTLTRNNNSSKLCFTIANGTNYTTVNCTTNLALNTWYHIVGTYDGSNIKIYINGNLEGTATSTLSIVYAGTFNIGGWSGNNYPINGSLSDIRLYNHCLSPMEVKELAKGLVLHYPLNRQGWGQDNIIPGTNLGTANWYWTMQAGNYTAAEETTLSGVRGCKFTRGTTAQSGWSVIYYNNINESLFKTSTAYKLSVDIYPSVNTNFVVSIRESNGTNVFANATPAKAVVANKWNHLEFDLTTVATLPSSTGETIYFQSMDSSTGVSYIFRNLKLEEGSIATPWCPNSSDTLATTMGLNSATEYDCSGFCNNGTRTGTFNWTSDTPKYVVSTAIEKGRITSANSFTTVVDPIFSVALWFKLKSEVTYTAYTDLISFSSSSYSNQPFRLEICGSPVGKSITWFRGPSGQSGSFAVKSDLSFDTWYHTVLVSEGNKQYSYYVNGVKLGTYNGSANSWTPTGNVSLGENINGVFYESDFRIYATALSADDVKSLYQNSAYIDSSGNVYGAVHSEV